MLRDQIVVIGGYGHVGQGICQVLAKSYPGKVYAAGKTLSRADAFSQATDGRVQPMQIDIREVPDEQLFRYESFEQDLADIADMSSQVTVPR